MNTRMLNLTGRLTAASAVLLVALLVGSFGLGDKHNAARAAGPGAQALVDRALSGPAGPDDEGSYRLIDPIGPGGATTSAAADEVFARTMVGGIYTRWEPYHDPFSFPQSSPMPGPYGPQLPQMPEYLQGERPSRGSYSAVCSQAALRWASSRARRPRASSVSCG